MFGLISLLITFAIIGGCYKLIKEFINEYGN